jgi:hypothetical protein
MGRLEELRVVDPVLTQIARGYQNADLVGDKLFPFVTVEKEAGKIPVFSKEAFKIYFTERAIRANSNRISPEGRSVVDFVLEEHDLEYPIDYREAQEDVFRLEEHGTNVVTEAIRLRHEKMCADLAQNPVNYPTGNKITLAGTSQWTDYSNSDPISDIDNAKEAIRGKIGRYPNVILLGAATYKTLRNHPKLLERIKYSQRGIVTPELMAEIFDVPNVFIGRAVYADNAGNFSDVWGDNAILAWVPLGGEPTQFRPSFGYSLRKRNMPEVDRRVENGGKLTIIRSTDIFTVKIVGSEAGYLIQDTNA